MSRSRGLWAGTFFASAVVLAVGCKTDPTDVSVPLVEEYRLPPKEPRFHNPP